MTYTEIITLDLPPMSDQDRAAMRARVLAAVRNEMERHNFEAWRDAHLTLLRWQRRMKIRLVSMILVMPFAVTIGFMIASGNKPWREILLVLLGIISGIIMMLPSMKGQP